MVQNMVAQLACGEELRIAAYNLSRVVFFRRVGEIDVVPQNLQDAFGRECPADQRPQRVKSFPCLVFIIYLLPFVEEFKRGIGRSECVLRTVADYRQRTVFQQGGNVAHVSGADLSSDF